MSQAVNRLVLTLEERVVNSIRLGESHFREFKSALEGLEGNKRSRRVTSICKDIGETLVAYCNADGGELLIGVEDDGRITGIRLSEENILIILDAYKTHIHTDTPIPIPIIAQINILGQRIMFFSVDKGMEYVYLTSDGRCLQRYDRNNLPRSSEQIKSDRQEQISKEYDRKFIDSATTLNLDGNLLDRLVERVSPGISHEKCLQYLHLADYSRGKLRLRNSSLLLFAKDYSRWFPKNEVRILKIRGTELKTGSEFNVESDELVRGNLITLLDESWEVLRPHLVETRLSDEGVFIERILYPEIAVREALINAIAHRDYSMEGMGIEIHIFDDRMDIISPGALLSSINIEDLRRLKGVHESRNVFTTRCLRELGYMRELGEGMRRIFSLVKQNDLIPPILTSSRDNFSIQLSHGSIFSSSDQIWLDSYENFDLSREERLVMLLGRTGRLISPQAIIDTCDIIDTADYTNLVTKMQLKGILYSIMNRSAATAIAKRRKISRRKLPRIKIRDVNTCRKDFAEMIRGLISLGPVPYFSRDEILKLKDILSIENIYNKEWGWIIKSLKEFNLMSAENEPTDKLKIITGTDIKIINDIKIKERISVELSEKEIIEDSKDVRIPSTFEIFLAGFEHTTTYAEIQSLVSSKGIANNIELPKKLKSDENRGYAFISTNDASEAKKIKNSLSGLKFKGRYLYTDWAFGKNKRKKRRSS